MTAGRYRTPMRVPALALVQPPTLGTGAAMVAAAHTDNRYQSQPVPDLFGDTANVRSMEPHPDFEARAAIWRDQAAGLISLAEAQRRSAAVGRVTLPVGESEVSRLPRKTLRPRHTRPAPNDSRQYASGLATTVMRDDRITPNAKAFLAVLRARCGKTRTTAFAKATMAAVMSRAPRTIARYLRDLEHFGYITTEIRRGARGLHTGLVVTITEKVAPFYEEMRGLAAWLAEAPAALALPFTGRVLSGKPGVTLRTLKKQFFRKDPLSEGENRHRESKERRPRPPF